MLLFIVLVSISFAHHFEIVLMFLFCLLDTNFKHQALAHTSNPSFSGGRGQEELRSKPDWANSLQDPILKKTHHKNRTGSESRCRPCVQTPAKQQKKKKKRKRKTLSWCQWLTPVILTTQDHSLKPVQTNSSQDPIWKILSTK
jgi:hypothetical protein